MCVQANVQKREGHYEWVDWVKAIGIFLVTLGHGGLATGDIHVLIYSFHMPLFFVLSGFLYKERGFIGSLKKGWRTLLIPYLIINALLLCYTIILYAIKGYLSFDRIWARVVPVFLGLGYETDVFIPLSTPLWFVVALFLIQMIMSLGSGWKYHVVLLFFSVLCFELLQSYSIDTLIPIDSALLALPFFVIGHIAKPLFMRKISAYWLPLLLLVLVVVNFYNGRVDINTCRVGNFIGGMYVSGIVGTLLVFQLARYLQGGVNLFASGTMLAMGFNLLAIQYAKSLWRIFFPHIPIGETEGCLIALGVCMIFIPVISFCKKKFRAILGYR